MDSIFYLRGHVASDILTSAGIRFVGLMQGNTLHSSRRYISLISIDS